MGLGNRYPMGARGPQSRAAARRSRIERAKRTTKLPVIGRSLTPEDGESAAYEVTRENERIGDVRKTGSVWVFTRDASGKEYEGHARWAAIHKATGQFPFDAKDVS